MKWSCSQPIDPEHLKFDRKDPQFLCRQKAYICLQDYGMMCQDCFNQQLATAKRKLKVMKTQQQIPNYLAKVQVLRSKIYAFEKAERTITSNSQTKCLVKLLSKKEG